jgi:hypothetical protein
MTSEIDLSDDLLPTPRRPMFAPPPPVPRLKVPSPASRPTIASQEIAWDCTSTLESSLTPVPGSPRPAPSVKVVSAVGWVEWIQRRVAEIVAEIGW